MPCTVLISGASRGIGMAPAAVQPMPAAAMTQPGDIAAIASQLLELPNSCVPFELAVSCNLEV